MGWFDTQLRERSAREKKSVAHAYWSLASVIDGRSDKTFTEEYGGESRNALIKICNYYHIEENEIKEEDTVEKQLALLQNSAGLMHRHVALTGEWWKHMDTPVLAVLENGQITAILPDRWGRFCYELPDGKMVRVDKRNARHIQRDAYCFYPPLSSEELKPKDIMAFLWKSVSQRDRWKLMAAGLMVSLLGVITPAVTQLIFSQIIPSGQMLLIYSVGGLLTGTAVSVFLLEAVKRILINGIQYKMELAVSSAIFHRLLNLPAEFFKPFSAGELTERAICLSSICEIMCSSILGTGVTALFSVIYMFQIFGIESRLLLPSVLILLVQLAAAVLGMLGQIVYIRKKMYAGTKVQSIVFSLLSGIQKIKVSGSENRAFAQWAQKYREEADASYNPPLFLKIQNAIAPSITIFGNLLIYAVCLGSGVQVAQYVAFNTAFGMVSSSMLALTSAVSALSSVRPIFELAEPIMKACPQIGSEKEIVKSVSGSVEINNVTFRYAKDGPKILDDLSLKIKSGQYVAVVGRTGCGKSTLLRLLLGFETPDTGAIYYDGKDVSKIDQKSLHRQIGVVMQNGKLFSGSIYSNITVSAPQLTMEEAWEAAAMAGMEEDIRAMPMGMHTVLSEGNGGISGGQKQRLMIARAIAPKPKLLFLDEATSALDNITQKQVSDSLNRMKCTRIVIAHRLSTIRECDRILVLDNGKIIEDGNYEELVSQNGFFAELVRRQQIQPERKNHRQPEKEGTR